MTLHRSLWGSFTLDENETWNSLVFMSSFQFFVKLYDSITLLPRVVHSDFVFVHCVLPSWVSMHKQDRDKTYIQTEHGLTKQLFGVGIFCDICTLASTRLRFVYIERERMWADIAFSLLLANGVAKGNVFSRVCLPVYTERAWMRKRHRPLLLYMTQPAPSPTQKRPLLLYMTHARTHSCTGTPCPLVDIFKCNS